MLAAETRPKADFIACPVSPSSPGSPGPAAGPEQKGLRQEAAAARERQVLLRHTWAKGLTPARALTWRRRRGKFAPSSPALLRTGAPQSAQAVHVEPLGTAASAVQDPRKGFGIAISGGRDRPSNFDGDTSIIISDVVPGGPADGRLLNRDKIAMVNGLSMENVSSSFAIQTLKSCGKVANITVKRPRKIHLPVTSQPKSLPASASRPANAGRYDSDEEYAYQADKSLPPGTSRHPSYGLRQAEADHNRGYEGDSSSERSSGRYRDEGDSPRRQPIRSRRRSHDGSHRRRSQDSDSDRQPFTNGYSNQGSASGLALVSGFKRLPKQDAPMKPVRSTLVKSKENEEYGLKLGSQIFIKHITDTGLAAKDASLQEGDLILKINGVASENMSLEETRQLIEKSEGRLTLHVLRDNSQFLVNIPEVRDSDSESSRLDDISDLDSDHSMPPPVGRAPPPPGSPQRNSFP
ncbi:PREDICTED: tight junction protein ZO-3-like, partial [Gekko japonicus]|uniref:Tight junction protein ZO-3-like n=1 Tax=Gekko japonicus TaxID=146911 RepID=A0ABM1KJ47_GEKJA